MAEGPRRKRLPLTFKPLTRTEECKRILEAHEADVSDSGPFDQISSALDRQFTTIHNRAQLLLGICGILISASVLAAAGHVVHSGVAHGRTAGFLLMLAGSLEIVAAGI